jgi:hypothetical protein
MRRRQRLARAARSAGPSWRQQARVACSRVRAFAQTAAAACVRSAQCHAAAHAQPPLTACRPAWPPDASASLRSRAWRGAARAQPARDGTCECVASRQRTQRAQRTPTCDRSARSACDAARRQRSSAAAQRRSSAATPQCRGAHMATSQASTATVTTNTRMTTVRAGLPLCSWRARSGRRRQQLLRRASRLAERCAHLSCVHRGQRRGCALRAHEELRVCGGQLRPGGCFGNGIARCCFGFRSRVASRHHLCHACMLRRCACGDSAVARTAHGGHATSRSERESQ